MKRSPKVLSPAFKQMFFIAPYIYAALFEDKSFAKWQIVVEHPVTKKRRTLSRVFDNYPELLVYVAGALNRMETNNLNYWLTEQATLLACPLLKSENTPLKESELEGIIQELKLIEAQ